MFEPRNNDGQMYSYGEDGLSRFNQNTHEFEQLDYDEMIAENSDLAKYRTLGTPSTLHVRMDTNRCILTNLVWNIGESPEIAQVISPVSRTKAQISPNDLTKNPFVLESPAANKTDQITIEFDNASMSCDNQVPVSSRRVIRRDESTVLNILRTIKAMTRMYPALNNPDSTTCRTQQENFVCLAKVSEMVWKVKSSATRRR